MPPLCTSGSVSSSHNSMRDDATRIWCGPRRVPGTYVVVRSSGMGRMTTRAFSKSVVVALVPPNSPGVTESYSNGRLIPICTGHVRRRAIERNGQDDDPGVLEVGRGRFGAAELSRRY